MREHCTDPSPPQDDEMLTFVQNFRRLYQPRSFGVILFFLPHCELRQHE